MTTVYGLLRRDGAPAASPVLDAMASAALLMRPAERGQRTVGPAGLGTFAAPAGGPAVDAETESCLVFEGHLHNRQELAGELSLPADAGDAEVALAALLRWGSACAARFTGPFTFIAWDGESRRMVAARDALGIRSFYYRALHDRVLLSSQLRQILAALGDRPALEEEHFALFLLDGIPPYRTTPYQGIRKLPPGHVLIADSGAVREQRYWRPEELPEVVHSDPRDYAAQYLEHLRDAVEVNLRADGPVWCDLSGGLDSSSAVCLAQEILRAGETDAPDFGTLTILFDETSSGDEEKYRRAVLDKYSLEANYIVGDACCVFEDMAEAASYYDEPNQQIRFFSLFRKYRELLQRNGVRALLRGTAAEVGALTENPRPLHLADYARSLKVRALFRELLRWQKTLRIPLINMLSQFVLRPLRAEHPLNRYYDWPTVPGWIDPQFARRMDLESATNRGWMPRRFRSVGDQWQYEKATRASSYLYRGYMEAVCENRYPFLHRPLVEYCLALPYEQKVLPGVFKPLLRRAMAGILPDEIRLRRDKGDIGHWVIRSVSRQWPELSEVLREPVLGSLGFVDQEELYRQVHLFGYGKAKRTFLLSSIVTLEYWTRHALEVPAPAAGAETVATG